MLKPLCLALISTRVLAEFCTGIRTSIDSIVVLGQKKHSSYDSTHTSHIGHLFKNIAKHYLRLTEADTLLMHEGDFEPKDFVDGYPNLRLCNLKEDVATWSKPQMHADWCSDTTGRASACNKEKVIKPSGYSEGYHKMIRFYSVTLWPTFTRLGYQWVMRFDDDSRLRSVIPYNLFENMRTENKVYAYRMLSQECGSKSFMSFVDGYWRDPSNGLSPPDHKYCSPDWTALGFYNNWFIADIRWWMTAPVQKLVRAFDDSDLIWTDRDNDLVFQTAVVLLLAEPSQVKQFTDFSYQHHTIVKGLVTSGGLETGTADREYKRHLERYVAEYIYARNDKTAIFFCSKTGTYIVRLSLRTPRCGGGYGESVPKEERQKRYLFNWTFKPDPPGGWKD